MEQLDVMFKYREEVVQMHLVQHGAAVKIQIWWRCLPCRMRALRWEEEYRTERRFQAFRGETYTFNVQWAVCRAFAEEM